MSYANQTVTIVLLSILFGFNSYSSIAIFILYAAETTFPIDQASVAGYLLAITEIFGFVSGLICASVLNKT